MEVDESIFQVVALQRGMEKSRSDFEPGNDLTTLESSWPDEQNMSGTSFTGFITRFGLNMT